MISVKFITINMEYVETTRGKRKLMYQGYYYVKFKVLVSGAFTTVIEPISAYPDCKSQMTQ